MIPSFYFSFFLACLFGWAYAYGAQSQYKVSIEWKGRPVFLARFLGVGMRLGLLFAVSVCCVLFWGCHVEAFGAGIAAGYMSFVLCQVVKWM
jgi:hypothetical protein